MAALASDWLGQRVEVVVDRPLGSSHPDDPNLVYELNYGFVPGTEAADGEPIDAYVIDADGRLDRCSGVVVGIVRRRDDIEDKLVVSQDVENWTVEEIAAKTHFQERYFDVSIEVRPAGD